MSVIEDATPTPAVPGGAGRLAYYAYAVARPKTQDASLGRQIPGIEPHYPVYPLEHAGLTMIVSQVPLEAYQVERLELNFQDQAWLETHALGHQRVMMALIETYTVLPLKFCTLYTDEARIRLILEQQGQVFRGALGQLEGASEWGIKVFCNRATLLHWAEHSAPQVQSMVQAMASAAEGARYLLQKRLQRAAQQISDELVLSLAQASFKDLGRQARASQRNPLQTTQMHGHADEMVLNAAFLVDDEALDGFIALVERLRAQHAAHGLSYVLTGPWPAYSFAGGAEQNGAGNE